MGVSSEDLTDEAGIGELIRLAPVGMSATPYPNEYPALQSPVPAAPTASPSPPLPSTPPQEREDLAQERKRLNAIRVDLEILAKVLAPNALLFIAMFVVFALFVIALFSNDLKILIAAGVFGGIIFFPTAFLHWKG